MEERAMNKDTFIVGIVISLVVAALAVIITLGPEVAREQAQKAKTTHLQKCKYICKCEPKKR